jgi:hypothetical protein
MRKSIRFCSGLNLLLLLAYCGCGENSEMEMKRARLAMDQAKGVHADVLAPKDFQEAQKSWAHAQAAVKEGKSEAAKVIFASAKIHFDKSADIAQAKQDALSRELSAMQLMISNNFDQVTNDLSKNNLSPNARGQVKAIVAEIEQGNASVRKLVKQEDFLKAVATAKDVQTKIYNAQLILAGKKPAKS